jgi:hypothetical protein
LYRPCVRYSHLEIIKHLQVIYLLNGIDNGTDNEIRSDTRDIPLKVKGHSDMEKLKVKKKLKIASAVKLFTLVIYVLS